MSGLSATGTLKLSEEGSVTQNQALGLESESARLCDTELSTSPFLVSQQMTAVVLSLPTWEMASPSVSDVTCQSDTEHMNPELTAWIQVPITVKLPGQCIAAGPQPPALVLRKEAAHSPRTLAV